MEEAQCLSGIADRIRKKAASREVSIEGLADKAEVSRSMMWSVLACEHAPNITWLLRVANALGCKPSELVP